MAWSRILLAALLASGGLACRKSDSSSAPQESGDGGAGPPGAGGKGGPGVVDDSAGAAKDSLGDPLPKGAVARLGSLRLLDRHLESMRFLPGGAQLVSPARSSQAAGDSTAARTNARMRLTATSSTAAATRRIAAER